MEGQAGLPALVQVKAALEAALGIGFTGTKALHFFHSTLVQTLFYGLFSAWVLWARDPKHGRFDWRLAAWYLRVPIIRSLFHQLADPTKLAPLGLVEVMDWAAATLDRVDRTRFFAKFEEAQAVQYFYEPFLAAYDPELRKDLGVWYTPREIVTYMVERVDRVLRSELGVARGLADERVHVLDPCCGTGAYLVEVLRRIDRTLSGEGLGGLKGLRVKAAALSRIHGFEIMPAPFVVAHLQVGLFLQALQAPLAEDGSERASIWLTNALTGWNEASDAKGLLPFPELEDERDRARHVKRDAPILVVLGNPPYNAFAGTSPAEEEGLVEPYKIGLAKEWGIKKFNLDELYTRFLRVAERRIVGNTGEGIICYISSYSYVSDPSFVVVRQRLLREFDSIWIDSLNGDSRETGKMTPDGMPDPSVFSTEQNREGIQLGTAIGLLLRRREHRPLGAIAYREFWGAAKRAELLASLDEPAFEDSYTAVAPTAAKRFSFRPREIAADYATWPRLVDLAATEPFSGLSEKREGALIDVDKDALKQRMQRYFDPLVQWADLQHDKSGPVKNAAAFDALKSRTLLLEREAFQQSSLTRFATHPLDVQWCYHTVVPGIWNRARPEFADQIDEGNRFLVSRMAARRSDEGLPVTATTVLANHHLLDPNASAFAMRLLPKRPTGDAQGRLHSGTEEAHANLSTAARRLLDAQGWPAPDRDRAAAEAIWLHALAICCAPAYLREHREAVVPDWPRVPLPTTRERLLQSAVLGERLAALLDPEVAAPAVGAPPLRVELRRIAEPSRIDGRPLQAADLALTAGWGYRNQKGAVMSGQGRAEERAYRPEELAALAEGASGLPLAGAPATALLGDTTFDIRLNADAYWANVPAAIWRFKIGGYQVVKKWLSYREQGVLGRPLREEEVAYVSEMCRRIAAILLMGPELDANYAAVKADVWPWPQGR